jgi:AcrR family transcriptional regulator
MTRSGRLHDRVAEAILDAAADVIAEQGANASMSDIAVAAGVGRTTLYRYFPSRETLLDALTQAAFTELIGKLEQAGLDATSVPEGIARVTRIVFGLAAKYQVLRRAIGKPSVSVDALSRLVDLLAALFERGAADGTWRTDLSARTLLGIYGATLEGTLDQGLHTRLGPEPAAAAVTAVFLQGAGARETPGKLTGGIEQSETTVP